MHQFGPEHRLLRYRGDDIVIYPDSRGALVHIPLRGVAVRCSQEEAESIEALCNLGTNEIPSDGSHEDDLVSVICALAVKGESRQPVVDVLEDTEPTEATLILTEACNLGCTYCYASASASKSAPMSFELAKAAIEVVLSNAAKSESKLARIRYIGGGEPTVEWKLLQQVQEYFLSRCREMGLLPWSRLVTNGTLLHGARADWIAKNLSFVTLSFDVLPHLQLSRAYADGRSSHDVLMRTIRKLEESKVDFHVRVTVGVEAAGHLVEIVEFLAEHTQVRHVRLEPVAEIGRAVSMSVAKPADEVFLEQFTIARSVGKKANIDVTCKLFNNRFRNAARFCEAEFSVAPDGGVSACHRYSRPETAGYALFHYGQLDADGTLTVDAQKLNRVRQISANTFEDCRRCPARWNCASGCLSARVKFGEVQQHGPLCTLTRQLLHRSLVEAVDGNISSLDHLTLETEI